MGGREYTIRLTVGLAEDVLDATGYDVIAAGEDGLRIVSLLSDHRTLGRVLWALVGDPSDEAAHAAFRRELDADALIAGWGALVNAQVGFTRRTRGEHSAAALERAIELEVQATETLALAIAEGVSKRAEEMLSEAAKAADEMVAGAVREANAAMQSRMSEAMSRSTSGAPSTGAPPL